MVIGNQDTGGTNSVPHPSGIPQDKIDNIMSGIANTGDVKMNNHRKKLRQRFDIIKKLGQGTYGKVQLGINKETGQEVAIKTIKKCKIEAESDLVRIRREVQIMSSVQHPNIIHIYEVFENREKMVLVMEFAAGGELYDYLSERKVLSEEEARRIFRQVATAVYYCHKHKICHRDLKLENILLDEHGNAKIADFGLSNVFDDQRLLATFCGSPLYASPEIVEGTPYHGPEVDCWSLGVLLYTLVYGSMPFDGSNFKRLVKQISQGDYYEPKKPSRASSLIREMLTVCPRKRANIEQICSHWWVNENDNVSCLELAEDLANQTPVRLDVLLSLTPAAVTAEQLVVPSAADAAAAVKGGAIPRSHSVGSIREIGPPTTTTEAERRILDMVAAGGEAALMPSPTRTITPAQSPIQTKRKLENTVSTENATGVALKKKEKPGSTHTLGGAAGDQTTTTSTIVEEEPTPMETEESAEPTSTEPLPPSAAGDVKTNATRNFSVKDIQAVGDICEQLIQQEPAAPATSTIPAERYSEKELVRQLTSTKLDATSVEEDPDKTKGATKVIKKFVNKHKTADLVNVIGKIDAEESAKASETAKPKAGGVEPATKPFVRKCSLQDESPLNKFNNERRKSRIMETAEKFQAMNAATGQASDKPKKLVIPGVSVGSYKKEYERKASTPAAGAGQQQLTAGERRALEEVAAAAAAAAAEAEQNEELMEPSEETSNVEASDSKASVSSFSLEDARKSMENSIALIRQAQSESSKEVNNLCAKPEYEMPQVAGGGEREQKLKNARTIIGNAIQPAASASQGISDNVSNAPAPAGTMKTSTASITLKSATLPRRKVGARSEIQLDIKPPPPIVEQSNMRFTTEMQHPIADLRSAPPREGPVPYSPIKNMASGRASSLEPKEHIIHIQKPPSTYMRTTSNTTTRSGSLSRQSTNDSESDTTSTANMSQSTITGSSQPIKKSPREFIIPIAVEGGGFITPREGSIEPSDSSHTAATSTSSRSTFTRLKPTRRIGSLLSETGVDDSSPFQKLRTSSTNRDNDDDTRFTLHKLRSSRPVKKLSQDNDSQSSGEEDDDDGFEILTAENLFSTLLQRVRALTNRMNVNNDLTSAFPSSSRLLSNMRQTQSPFWNQDPFGRTKVSYTYSETIEKKQVRLNTAANSMGVPWRHSMSRDLGSDMESMFSRTGATLPRGKSSNADKKSKSIDDGSQLPDEPLDLADLDLSRLRLSKTDLETLSSIAPGLPKCFQEQLLAKLPPTQARKLSRTLSVQAGQCPPTRIYKRSQSSGRPGSTLPVTKTEEERKELSVAKDKVENVNGIRDDFATKEETKLESTNQECSGKDPCPLYSSEVNEKYKYYSPYVKKSSKDILGNTEIPSMLGRPPSGRISPSASMESTGAVAKRPSQRRISRLLRPDFMEQPLEESPVEASGMTPEEPVKPGIESLDAGSKLKHTRHVRNKSLDLFSEKSEGIGSQQDTLKRNRRSLSRPREFDESEKLAKHELADKILQELQLLSTIRSQQERLVEEESSGDITEPTLVENKEKTVAGTSTLKKVKKVKPKEKSTESSTDADKTITNTSNTTTTVVKKVKKVVVKKSETPKTSAGDNIPGSDTTAPKSLITDLYSPKNVSKLKRPKSYPTKDSNATENSGQMDMVSTKIGPAIVETPTENSTSSGQEINAIGGSSTLQRESRLLRPKSYPTSKLMAPKELKKPSKPRLANMEGGGSPEESNTPPTAMVLKPSATTPSSSANPESVAMLPEVSPAPKKVLKITKKSKLSPPTAISSTSSASNTNSSVGDDSKESSPAAPSTKETPSNKLVEKKPNKGLLYAIGQKFEKLRASATSNSCANIPTTQKKAIGQSNDNSQSTSPEKTSGKYSFVKKTKSLGSSVTKKSGTPTAGEGDGAGSKETKTPGTGDTTKPIKADKRSRIDAMIRNLRERSVPRSQPIIHSESTYIKRAVSVEEMPGTFNRKSVNKVLGLFKRYEKDNSANRVRTARSASNIQRQITDSTDTSPIYQNADAILKLKEKEKFTEVERKSAEKSRSGKSLAPCNCTPPPKSSSTANDLSNCPECIENTLTSNKLKPQNSYPSLETQTLQGNKDRRKGLMLELSDKSSKLSTPSTAEAPVAGRNSKKYSYINDNEIYSNLPPYPRSTTNIIHSSSSSSTAAANQDNNNIGHLNNNNNNNTLPTSYNNNSSSLLSSSQTTGYRSLTTSTGHEAPPLSTCSTNQTNNNLMSPSFDNIANYSSDSRSYQEDCASTSTFRSPTEEPELYFDNWSVCSEDNYRMHGGGGATPSPAVSRLSRTSQVSSPTRRDGESSDPNESIVDRIRRRSFYCRFNEKKPKRTSSIVGPNAVREYYREQQAAAKTRSSNKIYPEERARSPDITQEFFRPLKLSPIGTELKPPVYKSPYASHEYTLTPGRPRKSLNDIRAPTSPSGLSERRYATSGSSTYNTPEKDIMPHTAILSSRYKTTLGDDSSNLSKAGGGGGSGLASTTAYYNTYNPKRRFSYNTANGSSTSSAAAAGSNLTSTGGHIDGYATMGRRPIRAYDHRTMSLLEPGSSSSYRHDANTPLRDYTTSLSRSNSRYRTQSSSRSPTNI
ncbi:serine-rich adhesin for platelets isoform X4 [Musca domestica]|uniref:Serine-rich adhesin for platelets isoform X4 n=1 Tax=Musca domestica TaxID=7370 RepID=A0ABM3UQE0_MUSDO|nr:serine-rich adhesin for platelets isoform X4 [Musca domestica]